MLPEFEQSCQKLFDAHKKNYYIIWTNDSVIEFGMNMLPEREYLLQKEIIVRIGGYHFVTNINYNVSHIESFKDAIALVEERKKSATINKGIYIVGDNNTAYNQTADRDLSAHSNTQSDENITNTNTQKSRWQKILDIIIGFFKKQ
jgi:hypothetical protein